MRIPRLATALAALALSTGGALAQSYTAPAGIPAATAPGGLEGAAGWRNAAQAIEDRQGIPVRGFSADRDIATGTVVVRPPRWRRPAYGVE
ncbi:hypothetical protein [Methylobacterium sp. JK268]